MEIDVDIDGTTDKIFKDQRKTLNTGTRRIFRRIPLILFGKRRFPVVMRDHDILQGLGKQ